MVEVLEVLLDAEEAERAEQHPRLLEQCLVARLAVQVRARYAISDQPMSAEEWKKQYVKEG